MTAMPSLSAMRIKRSALLSDERVPLYRWWLRRAWVEGAARITWVMLNPSDADHERDDPTMRAVMHFSWLWGFGDCSVVNLYPFRSPHPRALRNWLRDCPAASAAAMRTNEDYLINRCLMADMVVAAWGAGAPNKMHADYIARAVLKRCPALRALHCLGTTDYGWPKHPLARGVHRIPRDQQPMIWRSAA